VTGRCRLRCAAWDTTTTALAHSTLRDTAEYGLQTSSSTTTDGSAAWIACGMHSSCSQSPRGLRERSILAAAGPEIWIGLTSGTSAAALAYLGYLQIDNTVVTNNRAAARLIGPERGWRPRGPAQQNSAALKRPVCWGEAILATEQVGWVQQMSDTLEDLRDRRADAENRIDEG
jgi:hypothetical protein